MKYAILMIGKLRKGPELELFQRYQKRLGGALSLIEVDASKCKTKEQESELLLQKLPKQSVIVVLDERGRAKTTRELYTDLTNKTQGTPAQVCFLIGGADGHAQLLRDRADMVLQLSAFTFPHQLIPAMIAEQIYRVEAIRTGHPYHRD